MKFDWQRKPKSAEFFNYLFEKFTQEQNRKLERCRDIQNNRPADRLSDEFIDLIRDMLMGCHFLDYVSEEIRTQKLPVLSMRGRRQREELSRDAVLVTLPIKSFLKEVPDKYIEIAIRKIKKSMDFKGDQDKEREWFSQNIFGKGAFDELDP